MSQLLLSTTKMRTLVAVGFARSGTSFIGGVLASHPLVKYFCQPDHCSPLHHAQWEYWNCRDGDPASKQFFQGISEGRIDRDYIVSDWFRTAGCGEYQLGKQHVNFFSTTTLHAKIRWLQQYGGMELYAILRDPRAVVASLIRSALDTAWFRWEDYEAASRLVRSRSIPDTGLDLTPILSPTWIQALGYMVLVRTAILCTDLGWDPRHFLFYEDACDDPSYYLCDKLKLPLCDLDDAAEQNHNFIGHAFESEYRGWYELDETQRTEIHQVVWPLCERLNYPVEV